VYVFTPAGNIQKNIWREKMKKNTQAEVNYLDAEEQNLLETLERGAGWQPVKNLDALKKQMAEAARNTIRKDKRMNIRISQKDMDGIKVKAIEQGIPYQTLVSSIIHKYLSGSLVEKAG
jgi:predicted DNA binding CopG/RHH family protein